MSEISKVNPEILSSLIINGDISKLNSQQRVEYITKLCERVGIDPLTQPFKILKLSGKEVLYADKGCTQQLCKVYGISTEVTKKEKIEDVYVVTVRASNSEGRFTDEDGAVTIGNLKGDYLANALMKAVTKSKRRAVLAFCGLGMLDETEVETIPGAVQVERELKMPISKLNEATIHLGSPVEHKSVVSMPEPEITVALNHDVDPNAKIANDDGKALMNTLKANGWVKQDLAEFVTFEFSLNKISDICNKHMPKIIEYFSKPKEKANAAV